MEAPIRLKQVPDTVPRIEQEADSVLLTMSELVSLIVSRLVVKNHRRGCTNLAFDPLLFSVKLRPSLYARYIMLSIIRLAFLLPLGVLSHPLTLIHKVGIVSPGPL